MYTTWYFFAEWGRSNLTFDYFLFYKKLNLALKTKIYPLFIIYIIMTNNIKKYLIVKSFEHYSINYNKLIVNF